MSAAAKPAPSRRTRQLAQIHCLKRDLGLEDDDYRDVIWAIGRKRSAGELDDYGRLQLLQQLRGMLGRRKRAVRQRDGRYPGRPNNTDVRRRREMTKIEALLTDAGRGWEYAEALAKRICKRDRLEFCGPAELYKIVAALELEARRRLRSEIEAECAARGIPVGWAWHTAQCYFGLGSRADLYKHTQTMSLVLRYYRGEVTHDGRGTPLPPPPPIRAAQP